MKRWPIQAGGLTRGLISRFGLVGAPSFELTSEVVPVAVIAQLGERAVTRGATGWGDITAGAGILPNVGLDNPAGSMVNLFLDAVYMWSDTGPQTITVFSGGPGSLITLVTADQKGFTDLSIDGKPAGDVRVEAVNGTPVAQNPLKWRIGTSGTPDQSYFVLPNPILIPPGDAFMLQGSSGGGHLRANFYWRERSSIIDAELLGGAG